MVPKVVIIDYGVGNLLSVRRAFEHCGADVIVTSNAAVILAARRVVLPGVGAFADGMGALRFHGLDDVVRQVAASGTPLLGICLGMQMLLNESDEFGGALGLGLIAGRVTQIPSITTTGESHKIPHIGWNELVLPTNRDSWRIGLLKNIEPGEFVYFVHSFMAQPISIAHRLADCLYGGIRISAALEKDNVLGCQFHPEKSGSAGLHMLQNFLHF